MALLVGLHEDPGVNLQRPRQNRLTTKIWLLLRKAAPKRHWGVGVATPTGPKPLGSWMAR